MRQPSCRNRSSTVRPSRHLTVARSVPIDRCSVADAVSVTPRAASSPRQSALLLSDLLGVLAAQIGDPSVQLGSAQAALIELLLQRNNALVVLLL